MSETDYVKLPIALAIELATVDQKLALHFFANRNDSIASKAFHRAMNLARKIRDSLSPKDLANLPPLLDLDNVDFPLALGKPSRGLSGLDLSNVSFKNANLTSIKVISTKFDGADFTGANLLWANVDDATFIGARLAGARNIEHASYLIKIGSDIDPALQIAARNAAFGVAGQQPSAQGATPA